MSDTKQNVTILNIDETHLLNDLENAINGLLSLIVRQKGIQEMYFNYKDNMWCFSGTDKGLYFESDDQFAEDENVAIRDAYYMLIELMNNS